MSPIQLTDPNAAIEERKQRLYNNLEKYRSVRQAADMLGLKASAVRQAILRGTLTVEKVDTATMIHLEEIERYRQEHRGKFGPHTGSSRSSSEAANEPESVNEQEEPTTREETTETVQESEVSESPRITTDDAV